MYVIEHDLLILHFSKFEITLKAYLCHQNASEMKNTFIYTRVRRLKEIPGKNFQITKILS